jgi:hypothetical protein
MTSVEVDRDLVVALRPEAARRQLTIPRLINRLLAVTVEDKLTAAILDDDDRPRRRGRRSRLEGMRANGGQPTDAPHRRPCRLSPAARPRIHGLF